MAASSKWKAAGGSGPRATTRVANSVGHGEAMCRSRESGVFVSRPTSRLRLRTYRPALRNSSSMISANSSNGLAPDTARPLMKVMGVPVIPTA